MLWIQIDGLGRKLDRTLGSPSSKNHDARLTYALGFFGSSESRVSTARRAPRQVTMIIRIGCKGTVDVGVVGIEFLGLQRKVAPLDQFLLSDAFIHLPVKFTGFKRQGRWPSRPSRWRYSAPAPAPGGTGLLLAASSSASTASGSRPLARNIRSATFGLLLRVSLSRAATITISRPMLLPTSVVTRSCSANRSDWSPSKLSDHSCALELASASWALIRILVPLRWTLPCKHEMHTEVFADLLRG